MKKIFAIALALLMALSLTACGKKEAETLYYGIVTFGGMTEEALNELGNSRVKDSLKSEEYPDGTAVDQWKVKLYDDLQSAILGLQKGDVQEVDTIRATADYIMAANPGKFAKSSDENYFDFMLSMATTAENRELCDKLSGAIVDLEADGRLAELATRYISETDPEPVDIPVMEGVETIRVLVSGDYPPYDYVTADGRAAGFNVALLSEISEYIGMNIQLVYANSGARFASLSSGKVDAVFCTLSVVPADGSGKYEVDLPDGCISTEAYARQSQAGLVLAK